MNDFVATLDDLNISFSYSIRPGLLAEDVLRAVKLFARTLGKQLGLPHHVMLEQISKAVGFLNWHAFSTTATRLSASTDEFGLDSNDNPGRVFAGALPLLVKIPEDVSPTKEQIDAFVRLADKLANGLSVKSSAVLQLIAKKFKASSWAELIARSPLKCAVPLYEFRIDAEDGSGCFIKSAGCYHLFEEMDRLFESYDPRSKRDQKKVQRYLETVLSHRPDFLEARLNYAYFKDEIGDSSAEQEYDLAIKQAESLIPKGFKGRIIWGYVHNRFYHRLLYNRMRLYLVNGDIKKGLALAKKQLRLNPNDNQGVRFLLPAILVADAQYEAALKACKKFKGDWLAGDSDFIRSLCLFASGKGAEGVKAFLLGLFRLPVIRKIIKHEPIPSHEDKRYFRNVIPDIETAWNAYRLVVLGHHNVFRTIISILGHPAVISAEDRIYQIYAKESSAREQSRLTGKYHPSPVMNWDRQAIIEAKQISELLSQEIFATA